MTPKCLILAALAAWTPRLEAACVDKAVPNACTVAYSPSATSKVSTTRCGALAVYETCLNAWVKTCANTAITNPYIVNYNNAVAASKADKICTSHPVMPTPALVVATTTPYFDSSASSGNSGSDSGTSLESSQSDSFNQKSSRSDPSGIGSSGSDASGSSGWFLQLWQWILLVALSLCCLLLCAVSGMPRNRKKKPHKPAKKAPAPPKEEEKVPDLEPLIAASQYFPVVQPLQAMPTTMSYAPMYAPAATYPQAYSAVPMPAYGGYGGYPVGGAI